MPDSTGSRWTFALSGIPEAIEVLDCFVSTEPACRLIGQRCKDRRATIVDCTCLVIPVELREQPLAGIAAPIPRRSI